MARRVYLRFAFSRDPKVVQKAFEHLHGWESEQPFLVL
jgi:hypothetical protein